MEQETQIWLKMIIKGKKCRRNYYDFHQVIIKLPSTLLTCNIDFNANYLWPAQEMFSGAD